MVDLASFWKPEACGQTVLPDRSVLIGQKLVEKAKIQKFKCDILGDFQTLCLNCFFTRCQNFTESIDHIIHRMNNIAWNRSDNVSRTFNGIFHRCRCRFDHTGLSFTLVCWCMIQKSGHVNHQFRVVLKCFWF